MIQNNLEMDQLIETIELRIKLAGAMFSGFLMTSGSLAVFGLI